MIDIKDAYDYYVAHTHKSCNNSVVDFETFKKLFPRFINEFCGDTLFFDLDSKEFINFAEVPLLTKCGKSVLLNANSIMQKITIFKNT